MVVRILFAVVDSIISTFLPSSHVVVVIAGFRLLFSFFSPLFFISSSADNTMDDDSSSYVIITAAAAAAASVRRFSPSLIVMSTLPLLVFAVGNNIDDPPSACDSGVEVLVDVVGVQSPMTLLVSSLSSLLLLLVTASDQSGTNDDNKLVSSLSS